MQSKSNTRRLKSSIAQVEEEEEEEFGKHNQCHIAT